MPFSAIADVYTFEKVPRILNINYMNDDYIHNKIGPLAKFVAYLRTFSDIPYSLEIADMARAERAFLQQFGKNRELIEWAAPVVEARYKAIDYILILYGIRNILEVAAGLSPRGLAFTEDERTHYVETDLADIIQQKEILARKILQAKRTRGLNNLHFHPVNALVRGEIMTTLSFFDRSKKIAIVHDGLLPYLTVAERKVFAANVHAILSFHGGIWVHTDVSLKNRYRNLVAGNSKLRNALFTISTIINRDVEDNAFEDEADAEKFFKEAGFRITRWKLSKCVGGLASAAKLGVSDDKVGELLDTTYVWIMEPR